MALLNQDDPPPLQWRAHHILLCSNTFIGKGYTPDYAANLERMMTRINQQPEGMRVQLVEGPDDWCKPLLTATDNASLVNQKHCTHSSTLMRDEKALQDLSALLGLPLKAGDSVMLTPDFLRQSRKMFRRATREKQTDGGDYGAPRRGCHGCPWSGLCDEVAQRHYPNAKLFPQATTRKIIPIADPVVLQPPLK